jgi:DNA-binding IscR family transcriptional regulator
MLQVIEAIDGPICLNVCLISGKSCQRKAHCPAHPVWAEAQMAMVEVLSRATVAELAFEAQAAKSGHPVKSGHRASDTVCISSPVKRARR